MSRGATLSSFTAAAVLLVLLDQRQHGYALRDALESERLASDVHFGNLYRTLRGMEEGGWVASVWETSPEGPGRRVYEITPEGRQRLESEVDDLKRTRERLNRFFDMYENHRRENAK